MLKQISNSQAKGPVATATQKAMSLDSPCSQDQEKLRKTIDYDILPEMELRLHSLIKEINQCLDDLVKIKDEIPDEEDEKDDSPDLNAAASTDSQDDATLSTDATTNTAASSIFSESL